ncbi:hypothetical protein [Desulfosporosinus sp.]|uniref:hypothetical protein n=1 Tax=Desulfosporosinus sp. TaxID=157907 RepID=UPI0025C1E8D7|nr:hypothetical protein [Desulfosporosinus sp.]MBC2727057.1 hypothetical protein [Desulfosporosinus sp.]
MKYIIADPKKQNGINLKELLDGYEMLDFQGSFTTKPVSQSDSHEQSWGICGGSF